MELLKKLFKSDVGVKSDDDEKSKKNKGPSNWFVLLSIGLILLLLGSGIFENKDNTKKNQTNIVTEKTMEQTNQSYEEIMEKRLKDILSKVNGAGSVEVMITISYGKEIVIADDIVKEENTSQEKDNTGGTRDSRSYSEEKKSVMHTPQSGNTEPVILKEIEPKIEGIIIVSQGGGDIIVESNLRKAAEALFNIPAHKIEVFKMK